MEEGSIESGDCIALHDVEAFASMTPDADFAWNFGNYILKVSGLEGYRLDEKEWIVPNEDLNVLNVRHNERDDVYIVECE